MGTTRTCAAVVAGVVALSGFAAACGGDSSDDSAKKAGGPVTLTWWHNGTTDPLKGVWQRTADGFQKANPKVSVKVNPIQTSLASGLVMSISLPDRICVASWPPPHCW